MSAELLPDQYLDYLLDECRKDAAQDERPYCCDNCQEDSDELFPVDDSDKSVGYHNTLMVCHICLQVGRARGVIQRREADGLFEYRDFEPQEEF